MGPVLNVTSLRCTASVKPELSQQSVLGSVIEERDQAQGDPAADWFEAGLDAVLNIRVFDDSAACVFPFSPADLWLGCGLGWFSLLGGCPSRPGSSCSLGSEGESKSGLALSQGRGGERQGAGDQPTRFGPA